MIKNCKICNKEFVTYPSKILLGRGVYCSKKCSSVTFIKKGTTPWNKGMKLPELSGEHHPRWVGWRLCGRNNNYRELRIDGHYIREHRYIMELHLGRKLKHEEEVHHINGNGLDNRIENLQLMSSKHDHLAFEHRIGTYQNRWKA